MTPSLQENLRGAILHYALLLVVCLASGCSRVQTKPATPWNPGAAAAFLDARETWWSRWPHAARGHDTFCLSCHTVVPYALARPQLRKILGEQSPTSNELKLLENVRYRVRQAKQIEPYYTDQPDGKYKSVESEGTEAILNALVLASADAQSGALGEDSRLALDTMWATQQKNGDLKGAWYWLQFDLEPTEAGDSAYYGATLAAVAAGSAPEHYGSSPEIQENIRLLRDYLNREYDKQSLMNRVGLLWANAKLPGTMDAARQQSLIAEILGQQRADGGWSLSTISGTGGGWTLASILRRTERVIGNARGARSDGYATGIITYSLEQAGVPKENPQLKRGLAWLESNQDPSDGRWPSYALNKLPRPGSISDKFRSDAASSFAVLALAEMHQGEATRSARK